MIFAIWEYDGVYFIRIIKQLFYYTSCQSTPASALETALSRISGCYHLNSKAVSIWPMKFHASHGSHKCMHDVYRLSTLHGDEILKYYDSGASRRLMMSCPFAYFKSQYRQCRQRKAGGSRASKQYETAHGQYSRLTLFHVMKLKRYR